MEEDFFPQPDWILDAIHEKILPLKNHEVSNNFTINQQLARNKKGI